MFIKIVNFWSEPVTFIFFLALHLGHGEPFYGSVSIDKPSENVNNTRTKNVTPIHKALLTQRGYIQFLRWELPVPEIEEYTFCVWVKSTNLTYPHSIFSYSKNEKDRLVRAWITSQGRSIHLEIDNVEIFAHPSWIKEHRWYHICQSWYNVNGRYALWIDGQKKIEGYASKMIGHVIPSGGDIVLGQEYTDFDKGLEDGIEGAVLGFNLILASAFERTRPFFERKILKDVDTPGEIDQIGEEATSSGPIYDSSENYPPMMTVHPVLARTPFVSPGYSKLGSVSRRSKYSTSEVSRTRRFVAEEPRRKKKSYVSGDWANENNLLRTTNGKTSLGQQLVETSFENCQEGRASPRIGGRLMLISWTRTPVKVFGGAIVKNANNVCGNF